MRELGAEAYISSDSQSPFNSPFYKGIYDGEYIAIYPEIVFGNPFNAKRIIRWVLNFPGKLNGSGEYDESEIKYAFHKVFYPSVDENHVLLLPVIETNIFVDKHLERKYPIFYVGKGEKVPRVPETEGIMEINRGTADDPQNLCNILNEATVLYTYDNMTAMTEVARLCGCPVCIIPDGWHTKEQRDLHEFGWNGLSWGTEIPQIDSDKFRETYLKSYDIFKHNLKFLIEETQKEESWKYCQKETVMHVQV